MLRLPARFELQLRTDHLLFGGVVQTLATFESILKWSTLPFFEEYTDHGEDHLNGVLRTADALIQDRSRAHLSSADIAVLTLAVLLHDLGLHLGVDGFITLLKSDRPIPLIDKRTWGDIWQEFLLEAKRWDGKALNKIFGTTVPISVPPLADPEKLTKRDRRLIGEFIRRHHSRLAHEIAIRGFPGYELVKLPSELPSFIRDLSGLVARSHGSPLRDYLPYLEANYHVREFKEIHIVYLMVLLRVADYLQVQADRAPQEHLKISRLRSPLSLGEWKLHEAVKNITQQDKDPEAIFIQARPLDISTLLRLQELLSGLQQELDSSWAVLGEVYGRHDPLNKLGLELRRVRSNLDDTESLAKELTFIPTKASFEASGPELLKLLAEPLYGSDPNYGVRELLQNSVDACLERWDISNDTARLTLEDDEPHILIELLGSDDIGYTLVVADKGIGMSLTTLKDYFLKAGASYRRAPEWKKSHEDESGHSRVMRSGRFGIGVLAAFILGDQIEVVTRHVNNSQGIHFIATLDDDIIELKHVEANVGTVISVKLHSSIAVQLKELLQQEKVFYHFGVLPAGLYLLQKPVCSVKINEDILALSSRWPACGAAILPAGWHRIYPTDYKEVHWSYKERSQLACNGIAVHDAHGGFNFDAKHRWFGGLTGLDLEAPAVSVFDPDGNFPLILTRTALSTPTLPFADELLTDICRDICAFLLAEDWEPTVQHGKVSTAWESFRYIGLNHKAKKNYLCTSRGFTIFDPGVISTLNLSRAIIAGLPNVSITALPEFDAVDLAVFVDNLRLFGSMEISEWGRQHLGVVGRSHPVWPHVTGVRLYVPVDVWHHWPGRIAAHYLYRAEPVSQDGDWIEIIKGKCSSPSTTVEAINMWAQNNKAVGLDGVAAFAEYHFSVKTQPVKETFLSRKMQEILGGTIIPYKLRERQQLYPNAFRELRSFIDFRLAERAQDREQEKKLT